MTPAAGPRNLASLWMLYVRLCVRSGAAPMKVKTSRVKRLVPDYPIISAIIAIVVSVAVLLGITYRYATRSEPRDDLAMRMSAPIGLRMLPPEL